MDTIGRTRDLNPTQETPTEMSVKVLIHLGHLEVEQVELGQMDLQAVSSLIQEAHTSLLDERMKRPGQVQLSLLNFLNHLEEIYTDCEPFGTAVCEPTPANLGLQRLKRFGGLDPVPEQFLLESNDRCQHGFIMDFGGRDYNAAVHEVRHGVRQLPLTLGLEDGFVKHL